MESVLKRTSGGISSEMVVGLSALVVSVVAVFVGAYSAYTDRTYARASVWPNIQLIVQSGNSENPKSGFFSIQVASSGTGPAIIKHASVRYKGAEISKWFELLEPYQTNFVNRDLTVGSMSTVVLPANKNMVVFRLSDTNTQAVETFRQAMKEMSLVVCYCSVYEDCWQVDLNNLPKQVEHCPIRAGSKVYY